MNDGTNDHLYTLGSNMKGELGFGDDFHSTSYSTPQEVTDLPSGEIKQVLLGG